MIMAVVSSPYYHSAVSYNVPCAFHAHELGWHEARYSQSSSRCGIDKAFQRMRKLCGGIFNKLLR